MRQTGILEGQQKGLAGIDIQNKEYKEAREFECFKKVSLSALSLDLGRIWTRKGRWMDGWILERPETKLNMYTEACGDKRWYKEKT